MKARNAILLIISLFSNSFNIIYDMHIIFQEHVNEQQHMPTEDVQKIFNRLQKILKSAEEQ